MKEPSFMVVITKNPDDVKDPQIFLDNIANSENVRVLSARMDEERGMVLDLIVEDKPYQVDVMPIEVEVPNFFRSQHAFTDEEYQQIASTQVGLSVCMIFDDDFAQCFYDQLRILDAMFPEILAVLDEPSEKLLSGKWVALAAKSKILPAPRYLFTVQAISDDGEEIWLHTHGLKRCGLYEIEILGSTKETCNDHYKMMETFATRMLESEEPIKPTDSVFVGQAADRYLICTAVDWKEAILYYPDIKIGTKEDREDNVHGEDTCVLMLYKNERDEEEMRFTPVQAFNPFLQQNPMYMFSNEETARMRSLAIERIPYLMKAFVNKENTIILKIGLITDKEYWEEEDKPQREHIWFELKNITDDGVVAELTQDPYYVSGIKTGDVRSYPFSDITDWLIFTKECRIAPDDVYLLQ